MKGMFSMEIANDKAIAPPSIQAARRSLSRIMRTTVKAISTKRKICGP